MINASTASFAALAELDVVGEITSIDLSGANPVLTFKLETAQGLPILGIVPYWEGYSRFIRFTITKLVPGANGDPDSWVAYTRDATSNDPDYDTGSAVVDNGDGTYTFTFNTDLTAMTGVTYEPGLTHRVAGQIGRSSLVPLEEQNLWLDFVPDGSAVTLTRNIAVMDSCNECHDYLTFHGTRHKVEYCVQCHNPDLAEGEGDMSFMIHRIHNAGTFFVLDDAIDYSHVTYPQEVVHCRKCHNGDDTATPDGNNWQTRPNLSACDGCHDVFNANAANTHTGGAQSNNANCSTCHSAASILEYHATEYVSENNPELPDGYLHIEYDLLDASVDGTSGDVTINFTLMADGAALDPANMPNGLINATGALFRSPAFLFAYALPQDGISEPADWNNLGEDNAQPISVSLSAFSPFETTSPVGTLTFAAGTGVITAVIPAANDPFPAGATLRAIGLQGYFQQDLDGDESADASLHTVSDVVGVTGDDERREIVSTAKCAACHEFFEGHGGNRVFAAGNETWICQLCHVPNLTSSGRTVNLAHPEDAQSMKDLVHGIHASDERSRAYEFVRIRSGNEYFFDWSHVTFPTDASTSNCALCHDGDSYSLPLDENALASGVRTTGVVNGMDPTTGDVTTARGGANLPNATDWVNSATSSSCFYCHTSTTAWAHMTQNGGQLSVPDGSMVTNRSALGASYETCALCHGEGRSADVEVVHNR